MVVTSQCAGTANSPARPARSSARNWRGFDLLYTRATLVKHP